MWFEVMHYGFRTTIHEYEEIRTIFDWLKRYKKALEGSTVYDEMIDIYFQLDKKFQEKGVAK
ncbi:hypothetical protein [Listeria booriae]|uniref:Uncharacterized protein n=1 Tax=Listeria booriae TaxID=1552123 RepID=A0A7X0YJP2_9LIST|nr:hypothetical protein [Listeria booriae]MBC1290590.1 hypothetical protein [Listeria booriae]MBC2115722.1 hypothetical protein [Listeria booriae]MBC2163463.1 hypothetical protein [Listeria booriae]